MNPYLTGAGRSLLLTTILMIAVGSITGEWVLLLLGVALAGMLMVACFALLSGALVLERRLLKVELTLERKPMGALITGQPVKLTVTVTNRGGARLRSICLTPRMGTSLRLIEGIPQGFHLSASHALDCDMSLEACETGRHVLHGFYVRARGVLGLFEVGEYIAATVPLKFMPDTRRHRVSLSPGRRLALSPDRAGLHLVVQRGFGSELRELRHHQHGDPFRAIAWKATARTGRLMVKEYESEQLLNSYLCLDISSTMRGGWRHPAHMTTKLEHGIQLVAAYATASLKNSDRVGLITFDEKIHGHVRPRDLKTSPALLMNHLIGLRHIVGEPLTEYTEAEVVDLVARYLMVQERLDFRRRNVKPIKGVGQGTDYWSFSREISDLDPSEYDTDLLGRWLQTVLPKEERRYDDPSLSVGVLDYQGLSLLRRFSHLRGIELPYRTEARLGQKERGLVQSIEEILLRTRGPQFILIVSDLCGVMDKNLVVRGLKLALARRHRLAFIVPFTPFYVARDEEPGRGQILHDLFTQAEAQERRNITAAIEALGIPVLTIGPDAALPTLMRTLNIRRRH